MFNKYQKQIYSSVIIAFILGCNMFFSIKAPSVHKNWIRGPKVGSRTVKILNPNNGYNGGSGFHVIAPSGRIYILTNAHVCGLRKEGFLDIVVEGSKRKIPKRVIEIYKKHDLCLVEAVQGIKGIKVAKSISIGDDIAIVGHPKLNPLSVSKGEYIGNTYVNIAYSSTKVFAVDKQLESFIKFNPFQNLIRMKIKSMDAFQIKAYAQGGSSGSPVVNFYGNLVSVLFAGTPSDPYDSYSVPLKYIKDFLSVY